MRNFLLPTLLVLTVGCGGSALDRNVLAAGVSRVGLDFAADALDVVCAPERVSLVEDPAERAEACLAAYRGHAVGKASWEVWRDAIVVSEGDPEILEAALILAGPLVNTYQELRVFLAEFDVTLPALPSILENL